MRTILPSKLELKGNIEIFEINRYRTIGKNLKQRIKTMTVKNGVGMLIGVVSMPLGALLVGSGGCIGCHTAPSGTQNTGSGVIPYIDQITAPTYDATGTEGNTLAGGTFYFVRTEVANAQGHNVVGVAGQDGDLALQPPGYDSTEANTLGLPPGAWDEQLTCAGTYGCHGNHNESDPFGAVRGGHHGDDTPPLTGDTVAMSYRFLLGITGLECNTDGHKWEYRPTSAIHNQYKGIDRASDVYAGSEKSINYLCAQCHGFFHSADNNGDNLATGGTAGTVNFQSPWVRHPTDFSMSNAFTDEYASYNVDKSYNPIAPLASETVTAVITTITGGTDDIVSCVSCHRAHGTDWADLLRWDYSTMDAGQITGTPNEGCFICHTTK
jgi:hypothetical protein